MSSEDVTDDDDAVAPPQGASHHEVQLQGLHGVRLDKALAEALPELSRARIQALIVAGAVEGPTGPVTDGNRPALPGVYRLNVPAPLPALPQAEPLALAVLYEDAHLIVVDKAAGMATHPAPGTASGTLVNALLAHCGAELSGIGGVARPGIVHRLDKDTSGVMVAAKTDVAHRALSALFARHDIERTYLAFTRGAPRPGAGRIEGQIGRSTQDRKKMALLRTGGRASVTDYRVLRLFGPGDRPLAARVACTLQTGRTHQIRVHLASRGCPILGDATYGSGRPAAPVVAAIQAAGLRRQALHAAVLGFVHPVTGQPLRFETPLPPDLAALETALADV